MYVSDPGEREILMNPDTHALWRQDIIRFGDLPRDRAPGPAFVHAHIGADYIEELYYPGTVDIGTAVRHVGKSSFHLGHGIFADGVCKAIATSVIVQVQGRPLHAVPLTDEQKALVRRIGEVGQ